MTGEEFKKEIATNPKNIYVLASTDSAMIDLYANRFKQAIKATNVSRGIIRPYGKLLKAITLNIVYMQKLDDNLFDRNEYIFVYTDSIDKRSSIYKNHKDRFIELNNDYTNYVMKHLQCDEEKAKQFIKMNNNDFGLIKNALKIYKYSDNTYDRFTDYSNDIYGWVDAFMKKDPNLPNCTESPISVMALLATNCNNLLKIKNRDTAGMNPYVVMNLSKLDPFISKEELVQIIGDCFYLDCQIKKGFIDINYTLDYLKTRRYGNATTN